MKNKIVTTICILSIGITCRAQEVYSKSEITDTRDGKTYQTIKINNTVWLAENMKLKTMNAVTIEENDVGIETDGYYYPYEEADKVCPDDFELPKESDWQAYMERLLELNEIPITSLESFTHTSKKVKGIGAIISSEAFSFFEYPNPLNLKESGTLQGDKLIADGDMIFWSRMDNKFDSKYHIHVKTQEYVNHTHKGRIVTKNKKLRRKYVVRCVKRIKK